MSKAEFLMLAHNYDPDRDMVSGWYLSEKLDGIRCFWDGGVTRGMHCDKIPWANTGKHSRYIVPPLATGLWTRYGQPIQAPEYWTKGLPEMLLDGELTMGRGRHQETGSIVKSLSGREEDWDQVEYWVFDTPSPEMVFADRKINGTLYKKTFQGITEWNGGWDGEGRGAEARPFCKAVETLRGSDLGRYGRVIEQIRLPYGRGQYEEVIRGEMDRISEAGGEGMMLRCDVSKWRPERSRDLLKIKRLQDAEGIVVGYKWAKGTDLDRSITGVETNKLLGKVGSIRVRMDNGKEFDLSGFTDTERTVRCPVDLTEYGESHPGEEIDGRFMVPGFLLGTRITFRYRELTDEGYPKEARYWRRRIY